MFSSIIDVLYRIFVGVAEKHRYIRVKYLHQKLFRLREICPEKRVYTPHAHPFFGNFLSLAE